jgi:MinD-like ATPase involved in chromosome partitioning or flagellar assembly
MPFGPPSVPGPAGYWSGHGLAEDSLANTPPPDAEAGTHLPPGDLYRPGAPYVPPSVERLATGALLPLAPDTASHGWRKLVFRVSGGKINPGPSEEEVRYRRLVERIRTPLVECHRVAVLSLKGGVGKTTTTVGLGSTLAGLRGDRVVAIDANPDRGTLGSKVPRSTRYTVRDFLDAAPTLRRYVDVRRYLSQADSRLEVLASDNDPETSRAFADSDYRAVDKLLEVHFSVLVTDCGTGMLHSAMHAVLELADTLVIVSSSTADGGMSASATLDWLDAHGYGDCVRQAVTVISTFPSSADSVDIDALDRHFAARTRAVIRVPHDPHLATGGHIDIGEMRRPTRDAFLELAAAVSDRFGRERPSFSNPSVSP